MTSTPGIASFPEMKILHINNFRRVYGTEKYVNQIIDYLNRRGHENRLYIQEWTRADNGFKALMHTRTNLKKLSRIIDTFDPDVIHVHNIVNFKLLKYLLKQRPCMKSLHDYRPFCLKVQMRQDTFEICGRRLSSECFRAGCFPRTLAGYYRYAADWLSTRIIPQFPRVWVMSRYMENYMKPVIRGPGQLEMVHYFYDPLPEEPPPAPEERRIFSAGRLDPEKGYDRLIRAMANVPKPYELKIAGEGVEKAKLAALAESLGVDVDFIGYIPNESLHEWYR
ncbi:MAG TPA: glycosyltransferase family 4 protein, partial [bacterium]|nr:glycosyltransferase family 4 protein [bacterium]